MDNDPQSVDLPIWSMQTFTSGGGVTSPPSTPNQNNVDVSAPHNYNHDDTNRNAQNSEASGKSKVVPKRVAPPPPKGQKKKKKAASKTEGHEPAEYAVPITTHHWYNWSSRKKAQQQQKSTYKELDLARMEGNTVYSVPNNP